MIKLDRTIISCPNCSNQKFSKFGKQIHFNYELNYVICQSCTLIFMQPQMSTDALTKFYQNEYRILYQDSEKPTETLIATQTFRAEHLALFFITNSSYSSNDFFNYLDIGCSTGVHLDAIKKKFPNAKMFGVEPGDKFREYSIKKGHTVFKSLDDFKESGIKADAICLSHVLEHIPEPIDFLKLVNNVSSKKAFLIIEVPNTLGGHLSFELAHPLCFYSNSLINTCELAGFGAKKIFEHSVTSKYKLPFYLLGFFQKSVNGSVHQIALSFQQVIEKRRKSLKDVEKTVLRLRIKRKLKNVINKFKIH